MTVKQVWGLLHRFRVFISALYQSHILKMLTIQFLSGIKSGLYLDIFMVFVGLHKFVPASLAYHSSKYTAVY